MLDWIIIGGGIHGCTVTNFLLKSGKTTTDKIRIIDPHPEPMYKWRRNTAFIGMEFLRSPSVHHIDVDPLALEKYAKKNNESNRLYGKYDRPSLSIFNEYCDKIVEDVGLRQTWVKGKVNGVFKEQDDWCVQTESGQRFHSKHVVIAISINHRLNIPDWAKEINEEKASAYHVFNESLTNVTELSPPITVIGGGITAAHTAIKLSSIYPGKVTLLKRHPFRIHSFDSDPGWLGPKYMASFNKVKDYSKRRIMINEARHRGSLTRELYHRLLHLRNDGSLSIVEGEVEDVKQENNDPLTLHLKDGQHINTSSILFATGFIPSFPNEEWLIDLMKREDLQCANCGYPIVRSSLEWCQHLFVTGPLSELELGPVARNISGARRAAERIVQNIN
ncbi:FAD/NAD(P)-binding protein [Evansella halocellulosilytica]|uniref:FAD/NAD(P)-binding protein n=1 Tax=Evansella halocellulosilytica TaxID=2011013 RepID=UPI000BB99AD4|nr:FAD/NAD(P)-binding protein [Evansella halocellulosilytica]